MVVLLSEPMDTSTCAAAPFNHPKADIILRSSDSVYFRVFKLFLSLASPFFESLFELPQPTATGEEQKNRDGLAVVPMSENSEILDILLRFCYPCTLAEDPSLEVLKNVIDVLQAVRKYSLDAIEEKVLQALSNPRILAADPLRCFAVARGGKAREETLLAAKYTLSRPLIPPWFPEIDLISAGDLLVLLAYHQECGNAVYALRNDMSWIKSHYGSSRGCAWLSGKYPTGVSSSNFITTNYSDCECPKALVSRYRVFEQPLQWWGDFVEEVFVALRDRPCRATVESISAKTVHSVRERNCPACSTNISEGMQGFSELLMKKVEEVVSRNVVMLAFS